jgi:dihydroorotate dehydrogenase
MTMEMGESLLKINIQKNWNKPQEIIFQKLIFDELNDIKNNADSIEICLNSNKTGFGIQIELSKSILKKILKEVKG